MKKYLFMLLMLCVSINVFPQYTETWYGNHRFVSGDDVFKINLGSTISLEATGTLNLDASDVTIGGNFAIENSSVTTGCDTVASAATITLGIYNNFVISGTADIDSISTASTLPDWAIITIEFSGTKATTGLIDGKNLKIAGDFAYTPDDIIILQRRGVYFFEISRSAN